MSAPAAPNYLAELRRWLSAAAARFRGARQFGAVAHFEVARDIAADAIKDSNATARDAHRAETCDLEAARLFAAAQRPDSPGGVNITPEEGAPIGRLIKSSATIDHNLAERHTVPA